MLHFITQVIADHHHTGAILPSSRPLAKAMTATIKGASRPRRVLEVGPGSGSVTSKVLASLDDGDELDIVEINPSFCQRLELKMLQPFHEQHPDIAVRLHRGSILDMSFEHGFDRIICGLPFNNFQPQVTRRMFLTMLSMLNPGGELAYFEYLGMKAAKYPVLGPAGRRRLRRMQAMEHVLGRRHDVTRQLVLPNIPPARIIRLLQPPDSSSLGADLGAEDISMVQDVSR